MSEIETGGPAFPSHGSMGEVTQDGMTLRDYFAANAMAALMRGVPHGTVFGTSGIGADNCATYAVVAFSMADAMLAARSKA